MQELLFAPDGGIRKRGRVFVYFGDWRDIRGAWPADAHLIGDPPYGQRYESGRTGSGSGERKVEGVTRQLATAVVGDDDTSERDSAMDLGWSAAAVFGPARLDRIRPWGSPRAVLIWDKGEGVGMGDLGLPWRPNYETIAVYGDGWSGKRTTSVLRGNVMAYGRGSAPASGRRHPHEKPLGVVAELVSKAPRGPIVDPWLGSGTTLVAAALLGRDGWGAEIDPQYRSTILDRLAADGIDCTEL